MTYHLKLKKARSYTGKVSATREKPDIFVDDEATAIAAVKSGYFALIDDALIDDALIDDALIDDGGNSPAAGDEKTGFIAREMLEIMTLENLRKLANDLEIDTTRFEKREDYIEAISKREVILGEETNEDGEPIRNVNELNISELETLAAYHNIVLKGTNKKADIIAKIKAALDEATWNNGYVAYGSPTMAELQQE